MSILKVVFVLSLLLLGSNLSCQISFNEMKSILSKNWTQSEDFLISKGYEFSANKSVESGCVNFVFEKKGGANSARIEITRCGETVDVFQIFSNENVIPRLKSDAVEAGYKYIRTEELSSGMRHIYECGKRQLVILSYKIDDMLFFEVYLRSIHEPIQLDLVFVEGGRFQMGNELYWSPIHDVKVSSYYISKYEITQSNWKVIMGSVPSDNTGCDNCPVVNVSWDEVQMFVSELNSRTGKNYRLPTEAEWEYAARGGKQSKGFTFSGSNNCDEVAWYNKGLTYEEILHPVGMKRPNELGIYDMSGNVEEWCSDWFGDYSLEYQIDPKGPVYGEYGYKVARGGGYIGGDTGSHCQNSYRERYSYSFGMRDLGFRLVLPVK